MDFASVKSITIPEGKVKRIEIDGVVIWQSEPKNWVKYSTTEDGVTIYNKGLGYKDGYRVRSGGTESTQSGGSCTGYIPYVKGDKLYIWPHFTERNTDNAINFYDSSFNCLGQVVDSDYGYTLCGNRKWTTFDTKVVNGVSVLDITFAESGDTRYKVEDVAYVRVTNHIGSSISGISSGAEMIITKNEELKV